MTRGRPIVTAIFSLALRAMISDATAAERLVWFGTYTNTTTTSEGIYVARFDDATGELSPAKLAGRAQNPSYVALHPRLPMLYAVSEVGQVGDAPGGAVLAFACDPATGMLTARGSQSSGGAAPCHLAVDAAGKVVVAANYVGGSTICLGLDADGGIRPLVTGTPSGLVRHGYARIGELGIDAGRQEAAHAHSAEISADGRFAIVNDLGLDQVIVYAIDTEKATIAPRGFFRTKTASGPRRWAFHPDGRHGYAVDELDLTVTAFEYAPASGSLREIQTLSTLPAGVTERKGYSCAEIAAHPSGKFLYASNRGHDTIAMYAVDAAKGTLTFLGVEPIQGAMPRSFGIDPTGGFLLAGGQNSNTVSVFAIDQATGRLTFTGRKIDCPSPVSFVFSRP